MIRTIVFILASLAINAVAQPQENIWRVQQQGNTLSALYSNADSKGVAVRCNDGKLDVIVGFNRKLAERPPVEATYSFNGGQRFVQDWGLSKKGHLAFSPDPRWLAGQLARNNSFYIEVLSDNGYPNRASFPLAGSGEAIKEVLAACPDSN